MKEKEITKNIIIVFSTIEKFIVYGEV